MNKTFTVKGMHCEGCENRIQKVLNEIPGVSGVRADHSEGKVELQATEEVSAKLIRQKIKSLGFKVQGGDQ